MVVLLLLPGVVGHFTNRLHPSALLPFPEAPAFDMPGAEQHLRGGEFRSRCRKGHRAADNLDSSRASPLVMVGPAAALRRLRARAESLSVPPS